MSKLTEQLVERAKRVGSEVAAKFAGDVDAKARFPREAFDALKKEKLLSIWIPTRFGGDGATFSDVAAVCNTLGHYCGSTAMIYAMHQIQVACVIRHGLEVPYFQKLAGELVEKQLLFASATSEAGIGGNVRTSSCAVERTGNNFTLTKNAIVISYGDDADAIFVTARKNPEAPPSDQVLCVVRKGDYTLEQTTGWDTLGMRGTCSNGYMLRAKAGVDQILPTSYGDMSAQTMLPTTHLLWASLWTGIATDAVNRARAFVRNEARQKPGWTPPGAIRLAEVMNMLQLMRSNVSDGIATHDQHSSDMEFLTSIGFTLKMNNVKTGTSQMAVQVVNHAMLVCGIHGYRNDSKFSVGRHLRDVHSAAIMVSNDRIFSTNAALLLVHKDD